MPADRAASLTREVCHNLKLALEEVKEINPILVSRSDSTLRGHYPVETNVISEELGPFDAHFLVPAFFEGGRITKNSTHYLKIDGMLTPCHETEFARDSVFGYSTAYLPDYVEEKTKGSIRSQQVERFLLEDVRGDCSERLRNIKENACCVVDCEQQSDLNHFCTQLKEVAGLHRRKFLFRSAASLLTALAQLPPQAVAAVDMAQYVKQNRPGSIIVGSHVQKTSEQLKELLKLYLLVEGVEVDVERIHSGGQAAEILERARAIHSSGRHFVIFTSRKELTFDSLEERLAFGEEVSHFLIELVRGLPPTIGFLVSKGGITSNDVLSKGLNLSTSRVLGQILPGCSVVRCPTTHDRYPEMPVVIFPGNVGDHTGLTTVFKRLSNTS